MTGIEEASAPRASPKVDPESLVLRGRPRPVVRFRRSVIVGAVAAVCAALIGLTWIALEPVTFRAIGKPESTRPFERAMPEAVARAPRDYRDFPRLGPPLPGDLGRPILEAQPKTGEAAPLPVMVANDPAAERLAASREQRFAAEQAARTSSVLVQLTNGRASEVRGHGAGEQQAQEPEQVPPESAENKLELGDWGRSEVNRHRLNPPVSRWVISAGTVIPASLVTGLDSDLPGMIVAQITENVRDSASGQAVLIPQGARVLGRYDSAIGYGQTRAFVIWQRMLFPDGSSIRFDNMPASDASGRAGLTDRVDGHSWQLMKGVILSSLLGAGSELSLGGGRGLVRAIRESLQQNGSRAGEQIVARGLRVQPTIKVRPGWPVRVLVSEDLVLQPWKG